MSTSPPPHPRLRVAESKLWGKRREGIALNPNLLAPSPTLRYFARAGMQTTDACFPDFSNESPAAFYIIQYSVIVQVSVALFRHIGYLSRHETSLFGKTPCQSETTTWQMLLLLARLGRDSAECLSSSASDQHRAATCAARYVLCEDTMTVYQWLTHGWCVATV